MGHPTGFLTHARRATPYRPVEERLADHAELFTRADDAALGEQGARCMDCGVPFCQSGHGCPLGNLIPEWNDLVYAGRWREAAERLLRTNNFPEITGRVCPAPCESACVLAHTAGDAVTIKSIEHAIAERAWDDGWDVPRPPRRETGRSVGVVGSGPAGLAAAQELRRRGHAVTVYERSDRAGGLLTYGIPTMKLSKAVVARRVAQIEAEGVVFRLGVDVGPGEAAALRTRHDALLLATGAGRPRTLGVEGEALGGVHLALDYLTQSTRESLGAAPRAIDAAGKAVVVIGGGDTGTDCIATALRQGCRRLVNLELLPEPPRDRPADAPWPLWPRVLRSDYGHEEAASVFGRDPRAYALRTTRLVGDGAGHVVAVETVGVAWHGGRIEDVAGSERRWDADLVLVAAGYLGPETALPLALGAALGPRGAVETAADHASAADAVYAAGDCRRGPSLVVWAIREGRDAAAAIHAALAA